MSNLEEINSLFSGNNIYFEIPRYQRKYVWSDKNWRQILEDLNYIIDNKKINHFIGSFVFQIQKSSGKTTKYIIIDGQQRLLTIQIMLVSIYDRLNELEKINTKNKKIVMFKGIIKDLLMRKTLDDVNPRILIDYDDEYNIIIDKVINNEVIKEEKDNKSNIYKCFIYFKKYFSDKTYEQIDKLFEKIINTYFIRMDAVNEENAFNIFETLNARGTQLLQLELVKNYLFHYLSANGKRDIYKDRWDKMENSLYANKLDCDDFLYHIFKCNYLVKDIREEDLYDTLKNEQNRNVKEIKRFYNELISNEKLYEDVAFCKDNDNGINFLLKYFNIKGNKQFRCALISLLKKRDDGILTTAKTRELIRKIRNFLIIYNFRGLTANRINNDVHEMAYKIYKSNSVSEIAYEVNKFLVKDRTFFNLDTVEQTINEQRYSNKKRISTDKSNMFKYLLEIVNKNIYKDYRYVDDYKNWSIEHVVNDSLDDEIDSFIGNLLLVGKDFNSDDLKNYDYLKKRELFLQSSNSWVKDFANKYKKKFDSKDITKRSREIAKIIVNELRFNVDALVLNVTNYERSHK